MAAVLFATTTPLLADSQKDKEAHGGVLNIAVFGDSPYGVNNADTAQFIATPAFIQSINADPDVSLVLNVGDLHSGKQVCTQAYDQSIYNMWTAFRFPVVYTPGDNEWADCHKSGEGSTDPLINLRLVRAIFFASPGHTIAVDKLVWPQSANFDPNYPTDAKFVENVMWEQSKTLFVTINVPGGSNNDIDPWFSQATPNPAQPLEMAARTAADVRWLNAAFAKAEADNAHSVVIVGQSDMWDTSDAPAHQTNYEPIIAAMASNAQTYGKPVLYLNGDSHVYRSNWIGVIVDEIDTAERALEAMRSRRVDLSDRQGGQNVACGDTPRVAIAERGSRVGPGCLHL
jgi:hypothetical protein